jgi:hypothetical protein
MALARRGAIRGARQQGSEPITVGAAAMFSVGHAGL